MKHKFFPLIFGAFFACFVSFGTAHADGPTCGSTYGVSVPCSGITVLPQNQYGDTTGATNTTSICYAIYWRGDEDLFSYYVKITFPTLCDTSQGYAATPVTDQNSGFYMCMGRPDIAPTRIQWNKCVLDTTPTTECSETNTAAYSTVYDYIGGTSTCTTYATEYLNVKSQSKSYRKISCLTCPSGKALITGTTTIMGCTVQYQTCGICFPGQHLGTSGTCEDCDAGYYSSGGISLSCTQCPNADDPAQYTTSAMTAIASVPNSKITSWGHGDITSCYIKAGTYYDNKGAYRTPDCYENNTERIVVTNCSSGMRSFACTNEIGSSNTVYTTPNGIWGAGVACWCSYGSGEGKKWLFRSVIGPNVAYDPTSCTSSCPGACMGATLSQAEQTLLGCSN